MRCCLEGANFIQYLSHGISTLSKITHRNDWISLDYYTVCQVWTRVLKLGHKNIASTSKRAPTTVLVNIRGGVCHSLSSAEIEWESSHTRQPIMPENLFQGNRFYIQAFVLMCWPWNRVNKSAWQCTLLNMLCLQRARLLPHGWIALDFHCIC